MLKIGILTYHGGINYGTILQGYAVYTLVKDTFPNANIEFINIKYYRNILRPQIPQTNCKGVVNDFKCIRKFRQFFKENFNFTQDKLYTKDSSKAWEFIKHSNYDIIFVGSDTILEFKSFHKGSSVPFYWLPPTIKAKKFFIAASSRNLSYNDLTSLQLEILKSSIKDFTFLGVRDKATFQLISKIDPYSKKKMKIIPDPTFSLKIDYKYAEKYNKNKKFNFNNKPIVCLHLVKYEPWAKPLANFLRGKGYIVASLKPIPYADILINDLGPFEYTGIMKYFKLVITERFHDSVFCFKNKTPVITYTPGNFYNNDAGESKYTSLFELFNMGDSLFCDRNSVSFDRIIDKIDITLSNYNKVYINSKLEQLKLQLNQFMKEVQELV